MMYPQRNIQMVADPVLETYRLVMEAWVCLSRVWNFGHRDVRFCGRVFLFQLCRGVGVVASVRGGTIECLHLT